MDQQTEISSRIDTSSIIDSILQEATSLQRELIALTKKTAASNSTLPEPEDVNTYAEKLAELEQFLHELHLALMSTQRELISNVTINNLIRLCFSEQTNEPEFYINRQAELSSTKERYDLFGLPDFRTYLGTKLLGNPSATTELSKLQRQIKSLKNPFYYPAQHQNLVKLHHEHLLTTIYKEISGLKGMLKKGTHEWNGWIKKQTDEEQDSCTWENQRNSTTWRMVYDRERKLTIWTFKDPEKEAEPSYTGTNDKLVVKELHEDAYDLLTTSEFIIRGKSLANALLFYITENYPNQREHQNKAKKAVRTAIKKFNKYIKVNCQIDLDEMSAEQHDWKKNIQFLIESHINNNSDLAAIKKARKDLQAIAKIRGQHAIPMVEKALLRVQELTEELANILSKFYSDTKTQVLDTDEAKSIIKHWEKEKIKKDGRSNIVKFGTLKIGSANFLVVSAQFTQGEITIPSSMRNQSASAPYASNHVLQCEGHITAEEKVIIDSMLNRHSSLPPIDNSDELESRFITYCMFRQTMVVAATNILAANNHLQRIGDPSHIPNLGTLENPIEISQVSDLLLTPLLKKHLEKMARDAASEHSQLNNKRWGSFLLLYGEQRTLVITIPNLTTEVYLNLDYSFINAPVNTVGLVQKAIRSKLEKNINAEGIYKLLTELERYITFNEPTPELINHLPRKFQDLIDTFKKPKVNADRLKTYETELYTESKKIIPQLSHLYREKLHLLDRYTSKQLEQEETLTDLRAIIIEKKNVIRTLKNRIYEIYSNIIQEREDIFKSDDSTKEIEQMIRDLLMEIHTKLKTASKNHRDTVLIPAQSYLNTLEEYYLVQRNYFEQRYTQPNFLYELHTIHSSAFNGIKRAQSNCKSCEDRGGFKAIYQRARMLFKANFGYQPDFKNPLEHGIFHGVFIAQMMHLSTSRDNTGYNAPGAAGLQVKPRFCSLFISNYPEYLTAKFAKLAFEKSSTRLTKKARATGTGAPNTTVDITTLENILTIPTYDMRARKTRRNQTLIGTSSVSALAILALLLTLGIMLYHITELSPQAFIVCMLLAATFLISASIIGSRHYFKIRSKQFEEEFVSEIKVNTEENLIILGKNGKLEINRPALEDVALALIKYYFTHDSGFMPFGNLTRMVIQRFITACNEDQGEYFADLIPAFIAVLLNTTNTKLAENAINIQESQYDTIKTYIADQIITGSLTLIANSTLNDDVKHDWLSTIFNNFIITALEEKTFTHEQREKELNLKIFINAFYQAFNKPYKPSGSRSLLNRETLLNLMTKIQLQIPSLYLDRAPDEQDGLTALIDSALKKLFTSYTDASFLAYGLLTIYEISDKGKKIMEEKLATKIINTNPADLYKLLTILADTPTKSRRFFTVPGEQIPKGLIVIILKELLKAYDKDTILKDLNVQLLNHYSTHSKPNVLYSAIRDIFNKIPIEKSSEYQPLLGSPRPNSYV